MSWFKKITTLDILNSQIHDVEKKLLENQHTADHYAAMAEGSRKTLVRLRAMKAEELKGNAGLIKATVETPTKLRAAK